MLSRAHQLAPGKPLVKRGFMSIGTRRTPQSPGGPGMAGLWEGQSWGPAGEESISSGGCWERGERKGEDRGVQVERQV